MKEIIICDGKVMWQYIPKMKLVTKVKMVSPYEIGVMPVSYITRDKFELVEITQLNNEEVYVIESKLEEISDNNSVLPTITKVWVSTKDGIIKKIVMYTAQYKEMLSIIFKNVKLNVEIDDDIFNFIPPKNYQVIDSTKSIQDMMNETKKEVRKNSNEKDK